MIKVDLDMPKSCYECPFNKASEYSIDCYEKCSCFINGHNMSLTDYKSRPHDCPLEDGGHGLSIDSGFRFDRWLKKELYNRDMMQKELSEKSGVACATLSHYANGKEMPTVRTLELILDAFDMHMEFVQN